MPAESELFKDKIEVSLDGRQIFYLFFGGAVIVALVFVLGVMVGKRVEARAHIDREAASPARDPLAALDALGQEDDLTFPRALIGESDGAAGALFGAIDDELFAAERESGESASAGQSQALDAAKKADKAKAEKAKAEKAKAKAEKAKVRAEKAKARAEKEKARAEKARAEKARAEKARAEKARAEKAQAEKASASQAEDGAAQPEPKRKTVQFTLQLSSFRERAEADSFYDKLKSAGYDPYIVEAEVAGKGMWYRVRLGHYSSYEAAIQAKKDFEASQHIIAYVTRVKSAG